MQLACCERRLRFTPNLPVYHTHLPWLIRAVSSSTPDRARIILPSKLGNVVHIRPKGH